MFVSNEGTAITDSAPTEYSFGVLDSAPFGLAVLEPISGDILDLNPAAERVLGVSRTNVPVSLLDLADSDGGEELAGHLELMLRGGGQRFTLHRRQSVHEGRFVVGCSSRVMVGGRPLVYLVFVEAGEFDEPGLSPVAFPTALIDESGISFGHYADPTLVDGISVLEGIATLAPDIVYVYDPAERRNMFISGAWRHLGYTRAELTALGSRFIETLVHPADAAALRENWGQLHDLQSGQAIEHQFRLRHRDGSFRWLRCRETVLSRTKDGRARYVVGYAEDVTEHQRMLSRLRESEGRALAKASELEAVTARLSAADRRKDEFLALLAHELRNPLAPIRTSAQRLLRMNDLPPAARQASDVVDRQVRHLTRLVEDVLDVSRFLYGRVELRQDFVSVGDALEMALQMAQPLIEERRHQVETFIPDRNLTVRGDLARLVQVFHNLIDNSAKYTAPGGHIAIVATAERGEVVVMVQDNGTGIDPQSLAQVFEVFFRGPRSEEQRVGGLGLGLSLVQQLVAAHGGTVSARSRGVGLGSEFEVRLPAAKVERAPSLSVPRPARVEGQGSHKILVIDDDCDAGEALATYLQETGHQVEIAVDGPRALAVAERFRPRVVLLDIGLPGMDGHEIARRLRARPWAESLVILALSGYDAEEDRRRSMASGCNDHLVKPVDAESLLQLIARFTSSGTDVTADTSKA